VILMLRIYPVVLDVVQGVAKVVRQIEPHDPDLARQMRRAVTSVALNTAEGMACSKGNKKVRYQSALGSAREVFTGVEVAQAFGYIGKIDEVLLDKLKHVIATMIKLSQPKS